MYWTRKKRDLQWKTSHLGQTCHERRQNGKATYIVQSYGSIDKCKQIKYTSPAVDRQEQQRHSFWCVCIGVWLNHPDVDKHTWLRKTSCGALDGPGSASSWTRLEFSFLTSWSSCIKTSDQPETQGRLTFNFCFALSKQFSNFNATIRQVTLKRSMDVRHVLNWGTKVLYSFVTTRVRLSIKAKRQVYPALWITLFHSVATHHNIGLCYFKHTIPVYRNAQSFPTGLRLQRNRSYLHHCCILSLEAINIFLLPTQCWLLLFLSHHTASGLFELILWQHKNGKVWHTGFDPTDWSTNITGCSGFTNSIYNGIKWHQSLFYSSGKI